MPLSTYALLSLWAATLAVGFSALRMGRARARVLALPSLFLGGWAFGLVLLESRTNDALAERVLPMGILLAGAFAQSAAALTGASKAVVRGTWIAAGAVAILGLVAPRLFYGPGAREPGPLFWPLGVAMAAGSFAMKARLFGLARRAPAGERTLRIALFVTNVFAAMGGAGAIALYVTRVAPVGVAAAPLFVSVVASAIAVHQAEPPRVRAMIVQSFVLGLGTAGLTAATLAGLYTIAARIAPDVPLGSPTGMLVLFFLALPLDPLRQAAIDRMSAAWFARPIAARELSVAVEAEEARADQAERLAELGRMASAVAHELRNPLGVVLAEAKLLEREGANEESLLAIRREIDRARRFMDDLLRYARPRPLEPVHVDVTLAVARGVKRAVQSLGEREDRVVLAATPRAESATIEADPEAIADVVSNLVGNALIATADPLDDTRGRVSIAIETLADDVAIVVEDDGPGVPVEIEPRLFTAFTTGRGRDAIHPGTGLGLAICTRLVERHGGTLRHEPRPKTGARFVAVFPRTPRTP